MVLYSDVFSDNTKKVVRDSGSQVALPEFLFFLHLFCSHLSWQLSIEIVMNMSGSNCMFLWCPVGPILSSGTEFSNPSNFFCQSLRQMTVSMIGAHGRLHAHSCEQKQQKMPLSFTIFLLLFLHVTCYIWLVFDALCAVCVIFSLHRNKCKILCSQQL